MRCVNDEQLERLARGVDDPAIKRLRAHIERCESCWQRLQQAQLDAALVRDIAELREHRSRVQPLVEGINGSTGPDTGIEADPGGIV